MTRHPVDASSPVAGLAFVLVGAVSLAGDLSFGAQADLVWPVLLAALGLGLLLSSRSGHGADEAEPSEPVGAEPPERVGADDWPQS